MDRLKRLKCQSQRFYNRLTHSEDPSKKNVKFTTRITMEKKTITWTIENVYACPLNVGEYLESPIFSTGISDVTNWCLRLYPERKDSSQPSTAGLYICKISPVTKNFLDVTLYWKNGSDCKSCFNEIWHVCEEPEEIGTGEFLNSEVLREMESLTIVCNMEVGYFGKKDDSGNEIDESSTDSCSCMLSSDFQKLFDSGNFSDFVLQVDKKKFPVHKAILAARSNVFAAMFEHGMKESTTNTAIIENIEPLVISNVLQHMYTGKINDMTADKAIQLYPVADMYELFQLKKECTNFMLENISIDNACRIAVLADIIFCFGVETCSKFLFP